MSEQAITTVEELPPQLRAELVAKREAGTTLAELRKQYPQYSSEQIREALPAMPKPEAKTTTRRTTRAKTEQPAKSTRRTRTAANAAKVKEMEAKQPARRSKATTEKPKARAPKAERKPIDAKLAQRAVTMRGKLSDSGKPTSWAKIAYALKLVPEGAPKAQAGDAARRAYRQMRGQDAPTGPSDY